MCSPALNFGGVQAYARDVNSHWQPDGTDKVEFFYLSSLWEQYAEWSAYGAGVPIHLESGEAVVQYYTPYLSAIQIYTNKKILSASSVCSKSVGRSVSGSWSAECSGQESSWPTKEQIGNLYLEFVESSSPYARPPLTCKVYEMAEEYPKLMTSRSADLSPASWMSVAWYPIYQIPDKRYQHELSASFLTYHTISSSFRDNMPSVKVASKSGKSWPMQKQIIRQVSLPSFGLSSYKMHGNLWQDPKTGDADKFTGLYSAADSWLKQVKVKHDDFNFFSRHFYTQNYYTGGKSQPQCNTNGEVGKHYGSKSVALKQGAQ